VRRAQQLIVAIAIVAASRTARAQLCHTAPDESDDMPMDMSNMKMDMPPPPAVTARADLEADVATIPSGEYEGVVPSIAIDWWRLEARVSTPIYHLEYRGVKSDGPGDLLYSISGTVLDAHHVRAGLAWTATAPIGDAQVGLGMGMSMYMPGAWGSITRGAWGATISGSYGRMSDLGAPGGHHHAVMVGSLVNPMNLEELAAAVRGTYRATPALRLHVVGSLATPIDLPGTTRGYAAAGAHYRIDAWEVGLEAALGLTGDPFHARMVLDLARTF
jgi:hypothetical protein